jgi:copper resistance protein D
MNPFLVLTRAIHFGAVLWLFGEFVFFIAVVRPALGGISPDAFAGRREAERRLVCVAGCCVAIGIASAIAWLLLEAAGMSGMPFALAVNRQTLETVVAETLFGRIWVCRVAISLLLIAVLWSGRRHALRRRDTILQVGGTLLAGAYAATLAWTGHAAADAGTDRYIHLGADMVHLLAAGAWVGALPGLISLLRRAGDEAHPQRYALAASAAQRFSTLGLVTVSALVVTGLVNASYLVGSIAALFGTEYGRLLLCKLALFAIMVVLAGVNRLRLAPQIAAATAATIGAPSRNALSRLRRNATLEMAGGVAIVGVVAALGLTMPAAHMLHHEHQPSMSSEAHEH